MKSFRWPYILTAIVLVSGLSCARQTLAPLTAWPYPLVMAVPGELVPDLSMARIWPPIPASLNFEPTMMEK